MNVFLSHKTALMYWRCHFSFDSELGAPARVSGTEDCTSCKSDVIGSVPEDYTTPGTPIDVLVFDDRKRRRSSDVSCHAWQTSLPTNAFYRTRGLYVSSPEFVFLQMASILPIEQLIALGCELCGQYVLLQNDTKHPGPVDGMPKRITPLTSARRISSFLEECGKATGKTRAKRAIKYVVDGSRSPMETMTYMLLCLPAMLGGYGLPKPEMNATIELNDEARAIAQRRHCEGDLCWPNAKLDIEYHGEVHVGAAQMKSDVGRQLGIEHMGWRVITVTSPQVLDAAQFETVAKETARCLRKRLRHPTLESTMRHSALQYELERWTFGWKR